MKLKLNWEVILHAVCSAERSYGEGRGTWKRELAIDIIVSSLPWPRWVPWSLRRWIIGQAVDLTVHVLNWVWGKVWPKERVNTEALRSLVKEEPK